MMTTGRPVRMLLVALATLTVVGCSQAVSSSSSPSPKRSARPMTASPAPTATLAGPPSAPIEAARWFLEQTSARFELRIDRFKPDLPDEISAIAAGVVDPAGDRGWLRYDVFPDEPEGSPLDLPTFIVVWDPANVWASGVADDAGDEWRHVTRERAPEMALISRVQEEPLALVRFVAEADPATITRLPAAELDGVMADRWLVPVPVELTRAAYVPPDSYLGFDTIFDVDAMPLEAWLLDDRIVRLGYVLERKMAPYGGPDRHETWYDWSGFGDPFDFEIPPAGKIVDVPD